MSEQNDSMKNDPVKNDSVKKVMDGCDIIMKAAEDSAVGYVAGVPGSPVTHVIQAFVDSNDKTDRYIARWFSNEKPAMENAIGTAVKGIRTLVLVKHVGMNVLSDPLVTAVTHTTGAGLVIIAGDDPDSSGSQNCQDSRFYGPVSGTVMYDPCELQELYDDLRRAFDFSEEIRAPVIVRVTMDVLKKQIDENSLRTSAPETRPPEYFRNLYDRHAWDWHFRGKHQRFHVDNDQKTAAESEAFVTIEDPCPDGIGQDSGYGVIASGYACDLASKAIRASGRNIPLLKTGVAFPLPLEKIAAFCAGRTILVVEESEPYIEDHIRILGNVLGKRTGHIPFGKLSVDDILDGLSKTDQKHIAVTEVSKDRLGKGKTFCNGCLYPVFYKALAAVREKTGLGVSGDLGCILGGAMAPYYVLDAAVDLGSGICMGTGFADAVLVNEKRGTMLPSYPGVVKRSIACIGDFGLCHSGIYGIIDADEKQQDILVIVSDNTVAAMTGGQDSPDIDKFVRPAAACFIDLYEEKGELTAENVEKVIMDHVGEMGISVINLRWKCRRYAK